MIHAGSQPTNSGDTPSGIAAGFSGNGGHANLLVNGNVFINNAATVTADAGFRNPRLQLWKWRHHRQQLGTGTTVTGAVYGIYAHAEAVGATGNIAVTLYNNVTGELDIQLRHSRQQQ